MARNRVRVTKWAVKTESTVGTDATPGGGDFVRALEQSSFSLNPQVIDDNELRGGLGAGEHTTSGFRPTISIVTNMRGSGVADTPPETAALLGACGFVESVLTALPASPTTAESSGNTASVIAVDRSVATDWPSASGIASGILGHVVVTTNPTGHNIIVDYQVSGNIASIHVSPLPTGTYGATTTVQRIASVSYKTGSPSPFPSVTASGYFDGLLQKFVGTRGSASQQWTAGQKTTGTFDLSGKYGSRTDTSMLTGETDDPTSPPIWVEGILSIDKKIVCAAGLSWSLNGEGFFPDCPENVDGIDNYEVTGRRFTLTVQDRDLALVAVEDHPADLRAGTIMPVAALLGKRVSGTTGNRMALCVPRAKLRNVTPSSRNGMRTETLEFGSIDVDSEIILTFF